MNGTPPADGRATQWPAPAEPGSSSDNGRPARGDLINVGGPDDAVVRLQLAARWAEAFAPGEGDTLADLLRRFRAAFEYIDAVHHGLEPPSLEPAEEAASS